MTTSGHKPARRSDERATPEPRSLWHIARRMQDARKLYRTESMWGFHAASMACTLTMTLQDGETTTRV